ncbi:carbohydrate kinase family protein [Marinitoga aeolica]|uniref:Carbohydrate kinase n=1 Tax=Marinitoga aeolica TaxID=2809031 RepID=A0ABY8PRQ6_9BACT|nr:carbohydrate kinase [Marinitoga aeolica]WGS65313.1 carbohydrate kinase [Marinitoga aeolica]
MKKILTVGEILIDFICLDKNKGITEGNTFEKKFGGAPANVAAVISLLGGESAFVGKVGNDPFGKYLVDKLEKYNVDTSLISYDDELNTTLAFVSLMEDGERDFVFFRGADKNLKTEDVDFDRLNDFDIFHFGSATAFLGGELQTTYFKIFEFAKENKKFISFDMNYREDLWKETGKLIELSKQMIRYADFVKFSEEELFLISGNNDIYESIKYIHDIGAKIIAVTLGKEGSLLSDGESIKKIDSVKVKSIDSTGAGDAFVGSFLYKLSQGEKDYFKIGKFANKIGALVCTKNGALTALSEIDKFLG